MELLDTYEHYEGLKHQKEAVALLEYALPTAFLDDDMPFAQKWRKTPEVVQVTDGVTYAYPSKFDDGRFTPCMVVNHEQKALSKDDYVKLADEYSLSVAHVKAVIEVESAGSGFLLKEPSPARPKILFEGHWFYQLTPKPVSKHRPDLSHPSWTHKYYNQDQWLRLEDAMKFDEIQALKSASWGLGQVMGFNYTVAGCETVQQFITENFMGEYNQARHMMNFIVNNHLLDDLQRQDWHGFARGYNGSGYRKNNYHNKLADAYRKYGGI